MPILQLPGGISLVGFQQAEGYLSVIYITGYGKK